MNNEQKENVNRIQRYIDAYSLSFFKIAYIIVTSNIIIIFVNIVEKMKNIVYNNLNKVGGE